MEEKGTIGAEPQPTPEQWAEKLKQERELRKELVDGFLKLFQMKLHIPSEHWVEWSEYHKQIESLIQKAKDKSHE